MSVKQRKDNLRKINKSLLRKNIKFSAKSKHYKVLDTLYSLIKFTNSKNILFYMPLKYEPDVCRLRQKLSSKHKLFVPFMVSLSLKMVRLGFPFNISNFNVKEPIGKRSFENNIDMAVVPVIGVDESMARIGHGKGFYDRFFSEVKNPPKFIVFVQILDLFTKETVAQKHDICCDFYITPTQNYIKRGIYDRNFNRFRCRCGWSWRRISVFKKN